MAFCYQIRRCTDDVRPEGKAEAGAGGAEPESWGENRLTVALVRPLQTATMARGNCTAALLARPERAFGVRTGRLRRRTSRSKLVSTPGTSQTQATGPARTTPRVASLGISHCQCLGLPFDLAPLFGLGSSTLLPHTRPWRRTSAGTQTGIVTGPGATPWTRGLHSTTVPCGAVVSTSDSTPGPCP